MAIIDSSIDTTSLDNREEDRTWRSYWEGFGFNPPGSEEDTFDPYAELGEASEGDWIAEGISEYWEGLEEDPIWEGVEGGFEKYKEFFTPWKESRFADRPEWLTDIAVGNIEDYTSVWELLQKQELDTYELGSGQALDIWELLQEQRPEEWGLLKEGYDADIEGFDTLWELKKEDFEALGIEKADIWALKETSFGRQITETEDIYNLKAAELERRGIAAEDLWTLSQEDLAALNIDASEIWAIQKAAIVRRGEEVGTMWGLQSEALQEGWTAEKEQLAFTTQTGLRQAGKAQSQAIFASGMATAPTGIQDMEKDIRRQHGMQLSVGEEKLSTQLQIGSEQLLQTYAALQTDIDLGEENIEDINAKYARDIEEGEFVLDQQLEDYKAQGLIDDVQEESIRASLQDSIDIGSQDLANVLAGLTRDEEAGLAAYNIAVEHVIQLIAQGEMSLEHALETGQLSFNLAVASGLLTYQQAIDRGATAYEIDVGNVYENLQQDIWDVLDKWMAEQNNILANILAGDPYSPGDDYVGPTHPETGDPLYWQKDEEGLIEVDAFWGEGTFDTNEYQGSDYVMIPGSGGTQRRYLRWGGLPGEEKYYEVTNPTEIEMTSWTTWIME